MTLLYQRQWAVEFGETGRVSTRYDDIDIVFRAQYSAANPATCDITIHNPDANILGALGTTGTLWRVLAGYLEPGATEILSGTVVRGSVQDRSSTADPQVAFQLSASRSQVFRTTLSRAWSYTTASEVIEYIRAQMGLSFDGVRLASNPTYTRGYSLSGGPTAALSELVADCGCQYSISDGKLRIWPIGEASRTETADVWSESTGLLEAQGPADQKTIRATALLRGWVRPGDAIRIISPAYNGDVIAREITHQGDTYGDQWYTSIVGVPR